MFHSEVQILIKNISDKQKFVSKERFSLYLYSTFWDLYSLVFLYLSVIINEIKEKFLNGGKNKLY